jgi:hypothetical protein
MEYVNQKKKIPDRKRNSDKIPDRLRDSDNDVIMKTQVREHTLTPDTS